MVQFQSTVLVQILSAYGQSSSPAGNNLRVEVRTCLDDGVKKAGCQVVALGGSGGTYALGVRTGMQSAPGNLIEGNTTGGNTIGCNVALPAQTQAKGSIIDRYA
jgi:hypothetical protein